MTDQDIIQWIEFNVQADYCGEHAHLLEKALRAKILGESLSLCDYGRTVWQIETDELFAYTYYKIIEQIRTEKAIQLNYQ